MKTQTVTLDATGLRCPMPVLRLMKALDGIKGGTPIDMLTSDQASLTDIPVFCREEGHGCQVIAKDTLPYRFQVTKAR